MDAAGATRRTGRPWRVVIADDHTLVRSGLRSLLERETDIEVVGEAADGREVQRVVDQTRPDVVLLDLNMPDIDGLTAAQLLLRQDPGLGVVILSAHAEEGHVQQALKAGARGYLLKSSRPAEVAQAVRRVGRGEGFLDGRVTGPVLREFQRLSAAQPDAGLGALTDLELRLLRLLGSGRSNKEIGRVVGLAESTVKNRLTAIYVKIDVQDRTQAAIFAHNHGLVSAPVPGAEERGS